MPELAIRPTRHRSRATQSRQEYHAHRLLVPGRAGRLDDLGGSRQWCCLCGLRRTHPCPSLHKGQVVVMDNLRVHKSARVRQLIENQGCHVLFLPAYSPDFSPIEEAFSKVKTFLRRMKARTREALEEAIAQALLTVTSQDARGWFTHGGYLSSAERKS